MKRTITLSLVFLFAGFTLSFAQSEVKKVSAENTDIASQNPIALKYTDPSYPIYTGIGNPYDDISFKNKLEEYAKLNPPCPRLKHTGDDAFDNLKWQNALDNWYAYQPFFPRFIEYHRFNYLLTVNDDVEIYKNAIDVWKAKNPDKISVVFGKEENINQNH